MTIRKLNIGCGKEIKKSYVNLDKFALQGVDVVHDLDVFPYPFKDNYFDEIYCNNIIEHLSNLIKVMEELWRIAKPNATIKIMVPYYNSEGAFRDPTHKIFFHYYTLDYFTPKEKLNYYSKARFLVLKKRTMPFFSIFALIPDVRIPFCDVTFRVLLSYFIPNLISGLHFNLRVIK